MPSGQSPSPPTDTRKRNVLAVEQQSGCPCSGSESHAREFFSQSMYSSGRLMPRFAKCQQVMRPGQRGGLAPGLGLAAGTGALADQGAPGAPRGTNARHDLTVGMLFSPLVVLGASEPHTTPSGSSLHRTGASSLGRRSSPMMAPLPPEAPALPSCDKPDLSGTLSPGASRLTRSRRQRHGETGPVWQTRLL